MTVSARSYLTAGVAAIAASAVAIAPVQATSPAPITAAAVRLSAAVQPLVNPVTAAAAVLGTADTIATPAVATAAAPTAAAKSTVAAQSAGNAIINLYNAVEPWVQWGFGVAAWAVGYVPIAGYFAQQINIAYSTGEPIVASWVYSFAYLLDGNFAAIGPTLTAGLTTAWNNFVQGEINWVLGYLPPLPPLPPLSAAAAAPAAARGAAASKAPSADPAAPDAATAAPTSRTGHSARPRLAHQSEAATPAADADVTATAVDTPRVPTAARKAAAASTTAGGGQAASPVGGIAKPARVSAAKTRSTAGSARGHAQKAGEGGGE